VTFLCISTTVAEKLKVPQPTPYLAGRTAADFLNGTNFAVGGATALLDPAFVEMRVSLSNETTWFGDVLRLLGSSHDGITNENPVKNF
jgi:hypothetical protein